MSFADPFGLDAGWIVRKYGYRVTFMTGLIIYGIGALMFWPSGVKRSFGGFVGSMFIVGSGLSTLETSANPFIATCKSTLTLIFPLLS